VPDDFDVAKADKAFAARFFNDTWSYLDKPVRTDQDTEAMIHCAHASFYHWTRVAERTPLNLAIGYWQLSRVHAVASRAADAEHYAQRCMDIAVTVAGEPWIAGSAHEALARAAAVKGDRTVRDRHLAEARAVAARETDEETKKILLRDIESVP
jgi:hypothetical protein